MTPEQQIQSQYEEILRLRAEVGELKARVANLQRIKDKVQMRYNNLRAQLDPKAQAEKRFNGKA